MAVPAVAESRAVVVRRASLEPVASDRARAFRAARRHSVLVRALRIALPVLVIGSLASYGLVFRHAFRLESRVGNGVVSLGTPTISTDNLTMANPRYEGYTGDGGRFHITAKNAIQDFQSGKPIRLNEITGTVLQANGTSSDLTASRGTFDTQQNRLELMEVITIRSNNGMDADLTQATVFTKEGRIVSREPVSIRLPAGEVRGNQMTILQKAKQVAFTNGVSARLKGQPAPAAAAKGPPPGLLIGAADGGPIDVTSLRLDVDDAKRIAVFRDNVEARQGGATMTAPELEVHYEQAPAQPPKAGAPAPVGTASGAAGGKLSRILARTGVVITQSQDRVTSHDLAFDAASEVAILTGDVQIRSGIDRFARAERAELASRDDKAVLIGGVIVRQGENELKGERLDLDRRAGTSQLTNPGGRISAHLVQRSAAAAPSRPAAATAPTAGPNGAIAFRTDPNAPIDVTAARLDVNDRARTATFTGDVEAVQGTFKIRAPELVATYSGEAGLGLSSPGGQPEAGRQPMELQRVQAKSKVVVTSGDDQSARGDWADFDVKSNTVTIGGDVVLTQGRQVIRGPKLVIDVKSGLSRMETEAGKPGGDRPLAGAGAPGTCGGRLCAVFYPKELEKARKGGTADDARAAAGTTGAAKSGPDRPAAGQPAASSWSSTTRPAP